MPAPYSYDIRSSAISAVKRGYKKIDVCRLFKISRNTLDYVFSKKKRREMLKRTPTIKKAED